MQRRRQHFVREAAAAQRDPSVKAMARFPTVLKKMNDDLTQSSIYHVFALLDAAFAKTGGTDPVKVAAALEGCK